ncbi:uncharacterized protein zgc:113184 isoform X1 [Pseudorasbora parva]|uniref:uncharacterized protein zgc:113184 isoform X1 n=1 Tax=Pseudorasbora parva TaxID=51549 RepID=UPI00351EACDB
MEEAYAALYQEFVRLQSLCLKQAAMLQHLSNTVQRQQGLATAPTFENLFQCETGHTHHPAEGHESQRRPTETHTPDPQTAYDLGHINRGLNKLHLNLDFPAQTPGSQDNPLKTTENSARDELRKLEQNIFSNQTSQRLLRPWSSSFLDSELVSQAGGLFSSGAMLQSQVCEFCDAVFPGHTGTRGEFLRHLTTHMT